MAFRFVMQPAIAMAIAVRAGLRDARARRPAFLWTLLTDADERQMLLRSGWRDIGRVFAFAVVLDTIYQAGVLGTFYPLQALAVATLLAFLPYAATRGIATRIADRCRRRTER